LVPGLQPETSEPQTKTTAAMQLVLVAAGVALDTLAAKVETDYTEVAVAAHPVIQQFVPEEMADLVQLFWSLLDPRQVM
jgi:phosphoribosyl-ATP pyrophosphohydrolase